MKDILIIIQLVVLLIVLGLMLLRLKKPKYDGVLEVSKANSATVYGIEILTPPKELETKKQVVFEVKWLP